MRPIVSHTTQAVIEAALISLLILGLIAAPAFAARGGGKPAGGTLDLVMVKDANGNGSPNSMDDITFSVTTTATDKPMVGLRCWQGANFVHDGYIALYDGSWLAKHFTLGSSKWDPALDATCTARLFYYDNRSREKLLAALDFGVAP